MALTKVQSILGMIIRIAAVSSLLLLMIMTLIAAFTGSDSMVLTPKGVEARNTALLALFLFGVILGVMPGDGTLSLPERSIWYGFGFCFFGFFPVTEILPAWHVRSAGVAAEREAIVSYWSGGRRVCHGFHIRGGFLAGGPVCMDAREDEFPSGKKVILSGRATPYAMIVENVRW